MSIYIYTCVYICSFFYKESIGFRQYRLTDKATICLILPPRSKGPPTSALTKRNSDAQMEEIAFLTECLEDHTT